MAAGKVTSPKSILVMILVATLAFALVVQGLEAAASEDSENMQLENAAVISRRVLQAMGSYTLARTRLDRTRPDRTRLDRTRLYRTKFGPCGKCETDADCRGCLTSTICVKNKVVDGYCASV